MIGSLNRLAKQSSFAWRRPNEDAAAVGDLLKRFVRPAHGDELDDATRCAILAVMLRVAKANGNVDLEQIDRLYSEFSGGALSLPAIRFGISLYLDGPDSLDDVSPYREIPGREEARIVVAAGLAVGFEQESFSEKAVECIATAAHSAGLSGNEVASAMDLLETSEEPTVEVDEEECTVVALPFRTARKDKALSPAQAEDALDLRL